MEKIKRSKGFTLIELLVVIAIIGILSGFIAISMSGATNAAKDAKRKASIDALRKALLMYNVQNGSYPVEGPCSLGSNCPGVLSALVPNYLPVLPTDPNAGSYYTYVSTGTDFTVSSTLSNSTTYSFSASGGYAAGGSWPSGYTKRKTMTVTNSSGGTLSDYQFTVTVAYDSDMQADFDDLRFYESDNLTPINYWIESKTDSSTAKVWLKAPTLSSGANAIYMYYGNPSVTVASSGTNTFDFFDDFNTGTIPRTHWTVVEGTWSIDSQQLYQSAQTDRFLQIATDYTGTDYIVETDLEMLDEYSNNMGALIVARSNPAVYANAHYGGTYRRYDNGLKYFYATFQGFTGTSTFNTWYKARLAVSGNNQWLYINDSLTATGTATTYASGNAGLAAQAAHARFDNFRVRKYASAEPTNSFGAEESN